MANKDFKEIFIFVAGATPQIITETIYALSQKTPPVCPDEIYIVTTTKGKQCIEDTLIKKSIFKTLAEEYNLPGLKLRKDSFVVARDTEGNEIEDIRDKAGNEAIGDSITTLVMEKARDKSARLHCSLAGGRKTMSFYMGSALQLFGRPWDKLYHVLVSPEFESNPQFFFKPRQENTIQCRCPDGTILQRSTNDAVVQLAELPFIRLGSKLSFHGKGFRELVAEGQREIDTATMRPDLRINLKERTIFVGDSLIEMVPVQLMIYTTFLRQKLDHCRYPDRPYCLECTDCFPVLSDLSSRPALEAMAKDYRQIYGEQSLKAEELLAKWKEKEGMGSEVLRGNISKINRTIKEQLQDEIMMPFYQVTTVKKYAGSRYGVRVEKGKIRVE